MRSVELGLLGRFEVRVDGSPVETAAWTQRRARDLVKLLALAQGHRMPRERVIEDLWPQLDAEAGSANLHKAAHHARRALGHRGAVVLREGQVMLAPDAQIETDVDRFEATGEPELYRGELLPDDRYAEWAQSRRAELRARYLEALRTAGDWEQLAAEDPADEPAQRAVMRARLAAGDRPGALRAFERLCQELEANGLQPSVETIALHARIAGGAALDKALADVEAALAKAEVAERTALLATRADLLLAIGDRGAPVAYAEAAAAAGPEGMALRIRQAWAQLAIGDPASAQATLDPLEPRSDDERAAQLVTEAAAAWFQGDVEGAHRAAAEAQPLALAAGLEREARMAVQIQAMVAHSSGAWPAALRVDLAESLRFPQLSDTVFDGHLCVAEYALTSGEPHGRIRAVGEGLHANAVRSGARRAQAFAATLLGEVSLIAGRSEQADRLLREAVGVSREIGAVSAEALARVRLGETARARGEATEGDRLLADALLLSRWSPLSGHLQPLAYAAFLRATEDAEQAAERLDEAEAHLRDDLVCAYCGHAFRVAGAIAAARAGQTDRGAETLTAAETSAGLWQGGPWPAALEEVRGELAHARGEPQAARAHLAAAREAFAGQGWRLDADRIAARLASLA
ncbi:MAG: BTAD domain-containing putative transcriptional regulator [Solirubrobacterales bacterium]